MLTIVFANGQKLTTDDGTIVFYVDANTPAPVLNGERYLVNWQNVAYIRQATKEEIEYAKYHREG